MAGMTKIQQYFIIITGFIVVPVILVIVGMGLRGNFNTQLVQAQEDTKLAGTWILVIGIIWLVIGSGFVIFSEKFKISLK